LQCRCELPVQLLLLVLLPALLSPEAYCYTLLLLMYLHIYMIMFVYEISSMPQSDASCKSQAQT
jgi:hypothetical protein